MDRVREEYGLDVGGRQGRDAAVPGFSYGAEFIDCEICDCEICDWRWGIVVEYEVDDKPTDD